MEQDAMAQILQHACQEKITSSAVHFKAFKECKNLSLVNLKKLEKGKTEKIYLDKKPFITQLVMWKFFFEESPENFGLN